MVFVVGGITHSEMRVAHNLTKKSGRDIVIGGTSLDTPKTFLSNLLVSFPSFTGAQMVLTLKLISLASCYQDGLRKDEVQWSRATLQHIAEHLCDSSLSTPSHSGTAAHLVCHAMARNLLSTNGR